MRFFATAFLVVLVAGCAVSASERNPREKLDTFADLMDEVKTKDVPYVAKWESPDRGQVSHFVTYSGGLRFYKYGNFCGPGIPFKEGEPSNLNGAARIRPVDSIDRSCKLHDMCYMKFGDKDPRCDELLDESIQQHFENQPLPLGQQCENIQTEIRQAVLNFQNAGNAARVNGGAKEGGIGLAVAGTAVQHFFSSKGGTFPAEAGNCEADYGVANRWVGLNPYRFGPDPRTATARLQNLRIRESVKNRDKLSRESTQLAAIVDNLDCNWRTCYFKKIELRYVDTQYFLNTGEIRYMDASVGDQLFGR